MRDMASKQRRDKLARAQSQRARKQPRHKNGRFKRYKTKPFREEIPAENKWVGGSAGIVRTKNVEVGGKIYAIPVDDRGYVPESALIARFAQTTDGSRKDGERSVTRDLNKTSEKTVKLKRNISPEDIAEWWAYPNESDLQGIDDETTTAFDTDGATRKSSIDYQRRIGISGTAKERARLREALDNNFTAAELDKMTKEGGSYTFAYPGRMGLESNVAGYYNPSSGEIVLSKTATSGTIVHEGVHKLRYVDETRKGPHTTSKIKHVIKADSKAESERMRAIEEAETEAETTARMSPYKINGGRTGYYGWVAETEKDAIRKMNEDRERLVGSADAGKKGLKGKRATAAVEREFKKTHISEYGKNGKKA